jgi:hypothetical protein
LPPGGSADTDCAFAVAANPKKATLRTIDLSTLTMRGSKIVQTQTYFSEIQINIRHYVAPQQLMLLIF